MAIVVVVLCLAFHVRDVSAGLLSASLAARLRGIRETEKLRVIVLLHQQDELDAATTPAPSRAERRQRLIEALQSKAADTQPPILAQLAAAQSTGAVEGLKRFWIVNGLAMTASKATLLTLVARPEVERIMEDRVVQLDRPREGTPEAAIPGTEWNIARIRAPEVWELGFRGQGIVVASIDTGVFKDHPDLLNQWRGGSHSWFDAVNGLPDPYDDHTVGHGTHTMGTILGRDTGGTAIGVAPEAQWITCKAFSSSGSGTTSQILQCMQWIMDPDGDPSTDDAPGVVNNSWGTEPGCFPEFALAVKTWVRADIFPVFSAGNAGPSPGSGGSPAVYSRAFGVGATDSSDVIAGFSSRGPSSCDGTIFPELSAPGVNIRSASNTGGYRILQGTSMAAPHTTGCAALMLDAREGRVRALAHTLKQTAFDLGVSAADNAYGWGRIDCFEAVDAWR